MNKLLILAEKAFTVISFLHYSGGPLLVILSGGVSEGEGGDEPPSFMLINAIFSVTYLISFCLLAIRWKKVAPVILKGGLIWVLLGLAVFSMFWSFSPDITRTRIIALIGTAIFSLYFASRYGLKEQLQIFGWTFGLAVATSILFAILLPQYGQMGGVHNGAWRGIYSHKNVLGNMMVTSATVFSLLALTIRQHKWIFWSMFGVSAVLIILSKASSPIVNLLILMSVLFILYILRWRYVLMVPALMGISSVGIVLYSLISNNAEQVAGAFGKNLTLTGRTNFWPLIIEKIWDNPWFGYGFGAFWQGLAGPSAYIWNASTFKAPNGHNGYLDLCLDLGLVGFSIYAIKFITSFQRALAYSRMRGTPDGFWPTLLFCYIILSNLTESTLMLQNNLLWTMQVATFLSLGMPQVSGLKNPVSEEV
jgi:exopolysaccharide production protein ExoQ